MPGQEPYSGILGGSLYEREESIHENPTPSLHIQAPPDAFGTNIAEATQHLGQVSEKAGQELFDRAYAMQELHAHANVETNLADAANQSQDKLVAFKQLEGKAAVDALPTLQQDLDKIRTGATQGMSPYEIQLYDAASRRTTGQAKFSGATYAAQQGKVYQNGAADATINTAIRGMALDPNNTADSIAKINTAVDQKSDLMGLPADSPQRDMMRKTTVDTAVQAQLHAMARSDPVKALQTYNAAIKNGALFTNEAMTLGQTLQNAANQRSAEQAASGSMSGAVPPLVQGATAPPTAFFESRIAPGHTAIDVKDLQPGFSAPLSRAVEDAEKATGDKIQFTSGFRTYAEQQALHDNVPGSGRVGPAAPPGTSLHERGLAADIAAGPARDWMMQHAPQYGLATVANDPEHIELAKATGVGPQTHAIGSADRVAGGGVLGVLINAESRGQNIVSGTDSDSHGLKASQGGNASEISQGYFQIQNHPGGTWSIYAQKAGVDLAKYPSPRSAPYDVQWQVAQTIPVNQWGPRTKDLLRASGYVPLPGETLGAMTARYGGSSVQGQGVSSVDVSGTTVYHATATPEQSADRPLADVTAQALASLPPEAQNPEARDATIKAVEAQYSRNERIQADTNKRDMQTISGALYGDKQPSTLGELRQTSPEVGMAVDRLIHNDPEKIPKIQEAMDKNAKGDVPQTPERLKKYAELKTMASTQPEEFAKQDLMSAGLPMSWTKELVDAQVKGEGKMPYDPNLAAALRQPGIADQIQTLGIDPKTPDYNTLAAELGDEMKQFQTDNKRPPNAKEREEIATRLLQDKAIDGGLWDKFKGAFGYGPSTEKFFRMQAPTDWASQMKARVETEQGYTPTPMEINRVWNQMQYQKEYGGGAGKAESKIQLPQQPKGTAAALDKAASIPTALPKAGVDTDLPGPNHIPNWGPWHAGGTPTGPIIPGYVPKGNK